MTSNDSKVHPSFDASAKALDSLTNAAQFHSEYPQGHLHRPADHESAHTWISKILPQSTIEEFETKFHMGNYVIDRKTGEKTFEAMSIYVRVSSSGDQNAICTDLFIYFNPVYRVHLAMDDPTIKPE